MTVKLRDMYEFLKRYFPFELPIIKNINFLRVYGKRTAAVI